MISVKAAKVSSATDQGKKTKMNCVCFPVNFKNKPILMITVGV